MQQRCTPDSLAGAVHPEPMHAPEHARNFTVTFHKSSTLKTNRDKSYFNMPESGRRRSSQRLAGGLLCVLVRQITQQEEARAVILLAKQLSECKH